MVVLLGVLGLLVPTPIQAGAPTFRPRVRLPLVYKGPAAAPAGAYYDGGFGYGIHTVYGNDGKLHFTPGGLAL